MKFLVVCIFILSVLSSCSGQKKLCKDFMTGNTDTLSGIKVFHQDDNAIVISKMKNGMNHGAYAVYSPDGMIMAVGRYRNDKRTGTWYWYAPSGEIYKSIQYKKKHTRISTYSTSIF